MAKRTKSLLDNNEIQSEIRLNKYLSDSGVCSRREADKYIADGKVTIDGETAVTGAKVKPGQEITLNGKVINREEKLVLIAFNKPRGIVCTTDKRDKDNIVDYINYGSRIFPIGRLDKDSEGLILLTNDGDIVNKILRAGNNHDKEYIVTVNKPMTAEFLKGMAAGVPILDTVTKPCTIKALDKTTFQIIITQGLNRQIRRMCEYFGFRVLTLKRIRIMNISLGHLQLGGYRNVTDKELATLNELIASSVNDPTPIYGMDNEEDDGLITFAKKSEGKGQGKAYHKSQNMGTARKYDKGKQGQKSSFAKDKGKDDYKSNNNKRDLKKTDSNSFDSRRADTRSFDGKREDLRSLDTRTTSGRKEDTKRTDGRRNDSRSFDSRRNDSRKTESRSFDSRRDDSRKSESRSFDSRRYDSRKTESRSFDRRRDESRKSESRSFDS